jgi:phosphatidylinositol 3-kinase
MQIEAMGGSNSSHYADFRNYCCLSYNILRKHSGLIINLLGYRIY